jgi:hypothetical protein
MCSEHAEIPMPDEALTIKDGRGSEIGGGNDDAR